MTAIQAPSALSRFRRRAADGAAVASARQLAAVLAMVDALEKADRAGLPLLELAERSGLCMADTLRTLRRHSDYFVACGNTGKFTLNRFGPFRGEPERVRRDAAARLRLFRTTAFFVGALILSSLVLQLAILPG